MKTLILPALIVTVLSTASADTGQPPLEEFITVKGDQLFEGDKPFRFISWNIPNLQLVEDNVPFTEMNPWRLPDRFELTDALSTVRQMGGTVVRTYVLSVVRPQDTPDIPRHVLGPGKFNEEAFRALDVALDVANQQGVRVFIPFVDNWVWHGGRAEYAGFRGKDKDEFWTDPQLIADFKETIKFLVLRTNTVTGVRYCDDKAIFCWETGNELYSPPEWTREIAAYIKTLDTNHLVMDGFNAAQLRPESLTMPEIDIVTTHHYPGGDKSFAQLIRENAAKAKGKKPYVVGEFGFAETAQIAEAIEAIQESGAAGGLPWSLRFRNRDGGFYWHSEPAGGNLYKAFHWPGSPIADAYDEIPFMQMVRNSAYAIRGMTPPPIPVPAPPVLKPITAAAAITWNGSVGADSYIVERASKQDGPWTSIADNIDESFVQYRPLFADESAPRGEWFFRVRAKNSTDVSKPSNIQGPVRVTQSVLVDELADFSRAQSKVDLEIMNRDCRKAKEDAHRAAGSTGSTLVYQLPTSIEGFRVYSFFPKAIADLKFSVSSDGQTFKEVSPQREVYFEGTGDYDYWKPVSYSASGINGDEKLLKIEWTGDTQVGRVEIDHALE